MIHDLDKTIENLFKADDFIKDRQINITFDQPKREWSSKILKPTINLYLYNVRENPTLRDHHWEQMLNGRPLDNRVQQKRSPFRIDCFYMLTVWGGTPGDEHLLLTRCLQILFRHPILPDEQLVGSLRNPAYDIQAKLAVHDQLTNPAELWSALDNEIRPSIPYIITLSLDPWEPIEGPIVQTSTLRYGPKNGSHGGPGLAPDEVQPDKHSIGGTVRTGDDQKTPVSGLSVAIKGTGFFTTSDDQGRFVLGGIPSGDYILVAWPSDGQPVERPITIPLHNQAENYDLEVEVGGG
jgi:hypothetical protein